MRYSKEHIQETRNRIYRAALSKFRSEGFHGIGVDGISKAAGVTSGAFYKHFGSKANAFREVMSEGLALLRGGIEHSQAENGAQWLNSFIKWYFSTHTRNATNTDEDLLPMQGGCALPTLSPEVARTDEETRAAYEQELLQIVKAISAGLPKETTMKKQVSWSMLATMIGGVTLARAIQDEKMAEEIAKSMVWANKKLIR
ncbi:TetR/AcrR family transcriptional regulator [Ketobacter sp.]|uniref:TetR/AcrR family transcriptional regulator n=1 Tax=Ketobacter sp. TaxID=2083498 RepID=UPI000F118132|nr:TetR/AcrR family transcriptional regulator [Ketobacter sp.]RLT92196.1 MAG: TetR/AcrR family transcriptional regulator [Ketobacter sp.]